MCPKHVEEHNYRNKILCIKLESEVNSQAVFMWPELHSEIRMLDGIIVLKVTIKVNSFFGTF